MTESARSSQPTPPYKRFRQPPRLPKPSAVAAGALAAFVALVVVLAIQLKSGNDPALGPGGANANVPKKRVLVRRIEKRVVITRVVPAEEGDDGGAAGGPSSVTTSSPPVASAPAAAPAPAPTTSSS